MESYDQQIDHIASIIQACIRAYIENDRSAKPLNIYENPLFVQLNYAAGNLVHYKSADGERLYSRIKASRILSDEMYIMIHQLMLACEIGHLTPAKKEEKESGENGKL